MHYNNNNVLCRGLENEQSVVTRKVKVISQKETLERMRECMVYSGNGYRHLGGILRN